MSLNDKITVTWLINDRWKGTKYTTKCKYVAPESLQPLAVGENVSVKFNRNWYPARIVTPWARKNKHEKTVDECRIFCYKTD